MGELLVPKTGTKSPPTGPKTGTTFGYQKVGPLLTFDKGPNFWYPKWVPKVGPLDPLLVPKNGYQKFAHWAQIWYPFLGTKWRPKWVPEINPWALFLDTPWRDICHPRWKIRSSSQSPCGAGHTRGANTIFDFRCTAYHEMK